MDCQRPVRPITQEKFQASFAPRQVNLRIQVVALSDAALQLNLRTCGATEHLMEVCSRAVGRGESPEELQRNTLDSLRELHRAAQHEAHVQPCGDFAGSGCTRRSQTAEVGRTSTPWRFPRRAISTSTKPSDRPWSSVWLSTRNRGITARDALSEHPGTFSGFPLAMLAPTTVCGNCGAITCTGPMNRLHLAPCLIVCNVSRFVP
jgi:hypothetical protein